MWSDADSVTLLRLFATKGIGPRAISRALMVAESRRASLGELMRSEDPAFVNDIYPADRASRGGFALAEEDTARHLWDELRAAGVRLLVRGAQDYPDRLLVSKGDAAPPVLF